MHAHARFLAFLYLAREIFLHFLSQRRNSKRRTIISKGNPVLDSCQPNRFTYFKDFPTLPVLVTTALDFISLPVPQTVVISTNSQVESPQREHRQQ